MVTHDRTRLQRLDLCIAMASALFLPAVAITMLAGAGTAHALIAAGFVIAFDAVLQVVTKKTRTQILRESFVPDLVRAEASLLEGDFARRERALLEKMSIFFRLVLGAFGLFAGVALIGLPRGPMPMDVIAQWALGGAFIGASVLVRMKKRHAKLAAA